MKPRTSPASFRTNLLDWLPLGLVSIIIIGTSYGLAQQVVRQMANMPQIQMAQDKASVLANPDAVQIAQPNVNIDSSLQSFEIVYDANGAVLSSNAILGDGTPQLPSGVLSDTKQLKTITWQPQSGVRIAAAIVPVGGNSKAKYVLAGRNLAQTELLEDNLLKLAVLGLAAALIGSAVLVFVKNRLSQ